jgi:predicted nucleotidyltransferase
MKITGIVAEYNPFHMGHELQLKKAKELSFADGTVVVMSGNYVQRGEPAIIDKFKRAESAVYGGADLVIELPMPFSCQNAEMFANGAISELKKLPVSALSFGCESTDTNLLKNIALMQLNPEFNNKIKKEIKKGLPYTKALSNVISSSLGEESSNAAIFPNNILAIEYIKSIMKNNLNWSLVPVKRIGKLHDDTSADGYYNSGASIRKEILNCGPEHIVSVPQNSRQQLSRFYQEHECFNSLENYLELLYYKIIELGPNRLNSIYEVTEGLNNKIYSNVFKYSSIDEYIMSLKSKRYTYSKLRRMLLNILLNITNYDIKYFMSTYKNNSYIKILAFNDVGKQIIKESRNKGTIVINRYSDYKKNHIDARKLQLFDLTAKATNIYNIPLKNKRLNEEHLLNAIHVKL